MEGNGQSPDVADLLLERGKLTAEQWELVRRRQERLNVPPQRAVIDLAFASEEDTYRALAAAQQMEFVDLTTAPLAPVVLAQVPLKLVFHYHMVPVRSDGDLLTLAFADPPPQIELGNLGLLLSRRIQIVLTTPSAIHATIKKYFGLGAETIQKLRDE